VHKKQVKSLGGNNIAIAVTLSSLGLVQYHMNQYENAFESYQEALRLRRDHFGTDENPDIASTLNSIGLVLFKQSMYDLAQKCFTESLRIRTKLLGKDHRDVAILWYNIATIYFETGNDDIAIQMYKETLRVERAALGHDHPDVVLTLQHLGQVLQQIGDLDGALRYFKEALAIEQRKNPDDISVSKILNLIGNMYLQKGEVGPMMKSFTDATRTLEKCGNAGESLVIAGYNFYGLSKIHPPCAPCA
jgi:tetratricopeptide (TPR) repeat protein